MTDEQKADLSNALQNAAELMRDLNSGLPGFVDEFERLEAAGAIETPRSLIIQRDLLKWIARIATTREQIRKVREQSRDWR